MIRRVALAVSGGVDSSVSALILKQKGFDVQGVFMRNWDSNEEQGSCDGAKDAADAEWVCRRLQIPFHEVNFVKEYWTGVFTQLLKEYAEGLTPNPDVLCNKLVKFGCFRKFAFERLGVDAIATGHYADNSLGHLLQNYSPEKSAQLLVPKDLIKDQTLFLSQVDREALKRVMFPVAHLKKSEVKAIAEEAGLSRIARKDESMGICFIGSRNFPNFIKQYIDDRPGNFIDITNQMVIGEHCGIHHFTVGQNCKIPGLRHPYFVVSKVNECDIFVAPGPRHPSLFADLFYTSEPHWINEEMDAHLEDGVVNCQFRYQNTHVVTDCTVAKTMSGSLVVKICTNVRALTPGQFAVFYQGRECLGSARIREVGPSLFMQGREYNPEIAKTDQDLFSVRVHQ